MRHSAWPQAGVSRRGRGARTRSCGMFTPPKRADAATPGLREGGEPPCSALTSAPVQGGRQSQRCSSRPGGAEALVDGGRIIKKKYFRPDFLSFDP